jgi:hypothetical protein
MKCARAEIIAASIWFPMFCYSVACGTASQTQSQTQSVGNEHVIPLCLVGLETLAHGIEYFLRRRQEQAFQ